jgi:Thiamin pyrophosphokinase, vitamin B1 binding domain
VFCCLALTTLSFSHFVLFCSLEIYHSLGIYHITVTAIIYITLHHIIYIISHYIILHYFAPYHITLYHIISYHIHNTISHCTITGGENVAYLLGPGSHTCRLVDGVEGPGVALLPLGGRVRSISTTVSGLHGTHGVHCVPGCHHSAVQCSATQSIFILSYPILSYPTQFCITLSHVTLPTQPTPLLSAIGIDTDISIDIDITILFPTIPISICNVTYSPLDTICRTYSQGLVWDLSEHSLEMGGLVSSSNRIKVEKCNDGIPV